MWPGSAAASGGNISKRKLDFSLQVSAIIRKKLCFADKVNASVTGLKASSKKHRSRKSLMLFFPAGTAIKSNGDVFPRVVAANQLSFKVGDNDSKQ